MSFYTNAFIRGNKIYLRGINDEGEKYKDVIEYKPYLFINSRSETGYKTYDGRSVEKKEFDCIRDAKDFVKQYSDVDGVSIYGLDNFIYPFLNDTYDGTIEYDPSKISVVGLDIETDKKEEGGYAKAKDADAPITAITLSKGDKFYSLGLGDFIPTEKNVKYLKCSTEEQMLFKFIKIWQTLAPDVVTGWNIELYDVPYIINRINRILGSENSKKLSPWNMLNERNINTDYGEEQTYEILGVTVLDYMVIYKKFNLDPRESYKLDYICEVELGEKKLDYSEYGSLHNLMKQNFQLHMEYNIHDVRLINRLEEKLKMIDMVFAIAYDAKVNFIDALTSVRLWDVLIHNYLMSQNLVIKASKRDASPRSIMGGFVKDPITGLHKWVMSFDLQSLYPHLIMQYGISPELYHSKMSFDIDTFFKIYDAGMFDCCDVGLINTPTYQALEYAHENDLALTAVGCLFTKEKGFLSTLMDNMFQDRNRFKKMMIEAKVQYEETKDESLLNNIASYDNRQKTQKTKLNSAYGALANQHFRWYNPDQAEAITSSGQLSIRWIEKKLNEYLNKLLKTKDKDYIIAVDTDSVYIGVSDLVNMTCKDKSTEEIVKIIEKKIAPNIQKYIGECYEELARIMNAKENKMFMKLEAIADTSVFLQKKRYIMNVHSNEGVTYSEPKLKMMGIEAIRSSTPGVVRDAIKNSIRFIMNDDEQGIQDYVTKFEEEFKKMDFEQVAFPSGVNGLEEYSDPSTLYRKGSPAHVKAAIMHNYVIKKNGLSDDYHNIQSGDKIKYCYMRMPNKLATPVFAIGDVKPTELNLEEMIDYDTQFEKSFVHPMSRITDLIGWQLIKRSSLEDFFG